MFHRKRWRRGRWRGWGASGIGPAGVPEPRPITQDVQKDSERDQHCKERGCGQIGSVTVEPPIKDIPKEKDLSTKDNLYIHSIQITCQQEDNLSTKDKRLGPNCFHYPTV